MREIELNAALNIVPDPEKNIYHLSSRKAENEIKRLIRIFRLAEVQREEKILTASDEAIMMSLVHSNN
jgi:hypothetical protein